MFPPGGEPSLPETTTSGTPVAAGDPRGQRGTNSYRGPYRRGPAKYTIHGGAGKRTPHPGAHRRQDAEELHPDRAGRSGHDRDHALRPDQGSDRLPRALARRRTDAIPEEILSSRPLSASRPCGWARIRLASLAGKKGI